MKRVLWGAMVVGLLVLPVQAEVVISEIMYNPDSSESAFPPPTEWLELYNNGGSQVDLSGWYLEDEEFIGATFPAGTTIDAGEAVVVIRDGLTLGEFQAAWGTGFDVIVNDFPSLANSPSATNEILQLKDAGSALVDEVNYDDSGDWPSDSPDGPSIYVLPGFLTATANDNGLNWAASTAGVDGAYNNTVTPIFGGVDVGSPGVIPEPATLALLALGGVALIRRR